ncbi:MAG: hypothetical protein CFH18_00413 [Alphaproteobacteria bacterium MarineAlpha5_Bin8]|nr:MAG: hypothetical protein CFH17_01134 [Alphaproteobacteria bacterium MarineAlpha5_Bin7]PPR47372.1 MAG: hypothetical protein CFH18_00413 [Alphaproteobacteria bacterium MarineAlpha5_Bin8]PPR54772.1 MAG: hypothetical protein CFH16_00221 [Alphaproteobacteria bacterium MarineAlpha5_Bin6]|tara:strand:+ start:1116 stop:1637 length:522 start_codon:yes stop_codon:yes gene_type:complete
MEKITKKYLKMQTELHKRPDYGTASVKQAHLVKQIFEDSKFKSISDYGAGKRNLEKSLNELGLKNYDYFPYDPVFPDYGAPKPADLVCCIDVLEHIEEEFLQNVLDELKSITIKLGFFTISTIPARKILSDGRNAHLIQKPPSWWLPLMCERFEIEHMQKIKLGFMLVVRSKK